MPPACCSERWRVNASSSTGCAGLGTIALTGSYFFGVLCSARQFYRAKLPLITSASVHILVAGKSKPSEMVTTEVILTKSCSANPNHSKYHLIFHSIDRQVWKQTQSKLLVWLTQHHHRVFLTIAIQHPRRTHACVFKAMNNPYLNLQISNVNVLCVKLSHAKNDLKKH